MALYAGKDGVSSCSGDSGGPLVRAIGTAVHQVGAVSPGWGQMCAARRARHLHVPHLRPVRNWHRWRRNR
ncbi:trypsin-like serine protease [Microbacterium sp. NPDC089695]|uniref:trypsin-like serine protease n=1 Tax=Microbacterium sp. NPDC089695 TaxID=3364198 RepID=UPI0038199284